MAKGTGGKRKTKSGNRAKYAAVKDLALRKGTDVKGGGINRLVVTDGSIKAKV
jgi:hypothetical protein